MNLYLVASKREISRSPTGNFKSARHLQRFISMHDPIASLFHFLRHEMTAADYRTLRSEAMTIWSELAAENYAAWPN